MAAFRDRLARRTSTGRYIPEADGVRFLAILLVLLFHASLSVLASYKGSSSLAPFGGADFPETRWHVWDFVLNQGRYGVHLFFILSGFILSLPFVTGTPSLRKYYARRLTRLEPPYLLALTICFFLAPAGMIGHWIAGLFYMHTFVYRTVNPINGALWSLEVEILFYLLLPHLARVFALTARSRRAVIVGSIAVIEVLQWRYATPAANLSFAGVIQFFLAGLLLADLYCTGGKDKRKSHAWDIAGIACAGAFLFGWETKWFFSLLPLIGSGLLCAALLGKATNRYLSNAFVATVGGMAYSIYLVHVPLMYLIAPHLPKDALAFALTLVPCSFMAGLMFYVVIERPCMDPDWPRKLRAMGHSLLRSRALGHPQKPLARALVLDLTDDAIRSAEKPIHVGTLPPPLARPSEPLVSRTRSSGGSSPS